MQIIMVSKCRDILTDQNKIQSLFTDADQRKWCSCITGAINNLIMHCTFLDLQIFKYLGK